MYSYTYDYWNYVKVGAMVLLLLSVFLFFVAELTFQEFYNKIDNTDAYQIAHKKWFGNVIPITGLILGVMIPIFKAPMVIMCNTIDVIFHLLGFQGIMLFFYVRSHLHKRKQGIEAKNFRGIYAAATIGVFFSIAFVICMISNPYRTGAGIQNDWQINMTWKNLKTWELAAGFSFFIMNFLYSKKILDIWGNSFKKLLRYLSITSSVVIAVIMAVFGITNLNLNSKVNYEIQEVPVGELIDYDQRIWNWIQECNLSGEEINISRSYRYDPEKGNDITCYLIYMPHGYKGTKIKTNYYLGAGQKVLKLDFRNTSQIVDDKYYLCYLEVINNTEDFELRTFLDGEPMGYNDNGDTSYVALYRLL